MQPFMFMVDGSLGDTVNMGRFPDVMSRGMKDMSMAPASRR